MNVVQTFMCLAANERIQQVSCCHGSSTWCCYSNQLITQVQFLLLKQKEEINLVLKQFLWMSSYAYLHFHTKSLVVVWITARETAQRKRSGRDNVLLVEDQWTVITLTSMGNQLKHNMLEHFSCFFPDLFCP